MILKQGIQTGYIILEGWSRFKERDQIRDWCLAHGMVINATDSSNSGKANVVDQTIVRFDSHEDAMLCFLTIK